MASLQEAMKKNPVFRTFTSAMLEPFLNSGETRCYSEGAVLCNEGAEGREIYMVVEGKVNILCSGAEPGKILTHLMTLGPGDLIGEISFIEQEPRAATAVASTDVQAHVWPTASWKLMCEHHPAVGYQLMAGIARLLCQRIRKANLRVAILNQIVGGGAEASE